MNMIEDLVKQFIPLPSNKSPKGWANLTCRVCDDHPHKKRGGWKVDGSKISYRCFNCGIRAMFDQDVKFLSADMIKTLTAFSVPKEEINKVKFTLMGLTSTNKLKTKKTSTIDVTIPEILLPSHFYRLTNDIDNKWAELAREYLSMRGVDYNRYPFYLSTIGTSTEERHWQGRVILPTYQNNKLIFYQGRDLTEKKSNKYLNASHVNKDKILFGLDQLTLHTTDPIFVVEGFFDAFSIGGVATFGNEMSVNQIELLKRSARKKIIIPDRWGSGSVLAKQGLSLGWDVSFPDIGSDCKDINDAAVKYGTLYITNSIIKHSTSGFDGEMKVKLFCK